MIMKRTTLWAVAFALIFGFLFGYDPNQSVAADKPQVIKLGITGEDHRIWDIVKQKLVQENIDLQVISFADYIRPNLALAEKEIDLNAFQHYAYFDKFKADHNLQLVVIGETVLAPMAIFSASIKSLKNLKEGGKVAIPNDATNGGRALLLLQSAGLIKIKSDAGLLPTIHDVVRNPKQLQIIELAAPQIPRSLQDVDIAAINSGIAIDAKLSPVKDSIYLENAKLKTAKPYINIIVARAEDKNNPLYRKVVKAYRSGEVKQAIESIYQGALISTF